MKIRYKVTRKELWSVAWRYSLLRSIYLIAFVPLLAFVWLSNFWYDKYATYPISQRVAIATVSSLFVLFLAALVMFLVLLVQVFIAKRGGSVGEHTIEITDDGLREVSSVADITSKWTAIRGLSIRRSIIIIRTDALLHMIPTKCSMIEGDLEPFLAELKRKVSRSD